MSTDHDELRRLLGGYLLGGLDETDTDRLDAHLRDCDQCRDELERLAPVPELLQRLPDAQRTAGGGPALISLSARPTAEKVESLLSKMRAERTRENRMARVRWLAAAAVVLVAAAIGFGVIRGNQQAAQQQPQALPSQQLVTAQFEPAAGSGLSGQAVLISKQWGVSVALDVTKLRGQGPFYCQVRNADGHIEQAAVWGPTQSGNAKVTGASSFQLRTVSAITVADDDGHVLATARVE